MSCASNHRIQACLFNIEVDIEPVKHIEWDIAEHRVDHLDVATASADIFGSFSADLDPGRIEGRILVLVGADQNHVLEPAESFHLGQLVKVALLKGLAIGHAKLGDGYRFLPFVHDPHAR